MDTRDRLASLLDADPSCVMGHVLDGYLHMLSSKRAGFLRAIEALGRAEAVAASAAGLSKRERLHVGALAAWSRGDMRGAVLKWDAVLDDAPRDIVALKVSQFVLSYLGESARMHETVERVLPAWSAAVPGYGYVLGCHAYALEETGEYTRAEAIGRLATDINPGDIWAAHAVAHVAEMEGRLHDGLAWISSQSGHWSSCNNFTFHLRWHEALLHLDLERNARVLTLYDDVVRRPESDEYLDMANAVSLLWRLEQAEVDVGTRWTQLADHARSHMSDHALVFVDLHYLMAIVAAADANAIGAFMESCERFALVDSGTEASVMADVGLPLARAVMAHRRGAYGDVVELLMPVRGKFRWIGGSHAQRDLFDQLLIDAARRGGHLDVAEELLAERTSKRPRNIWAWREYANVLDSIGSPGAAAASRRLDELRAS
ncbi:MAG TPA: tetratricopeptide repeat protein [Gemmatimonadaceae bacterium]|nr:tetratricopeptide repeat protein [Gemmatimonadaceae bacterium]